MSSLIELSPASVSVAVAEGMVAGVIIEAAPPAVMLALGVPFILSGVKKNIDHWRLFVEEMKYNSET